MKSFKEWKCDNILGVTLEQFIGVASDYFDAVLKGGMKTYVEHKVENLTEAAETTRYSIEVNYRTKPKEVLESYAKISLGYVSAALKHRGYHTKHVYSEKPLRLLVSARNWDDGSWVGCVTWNHEHDCFVISSGYFNKMKNSVSVQKSQKCKGEDAAEVSRELVNLMHDLKDKKDKQMPKLKPVPLKRGPKA